MEEENYEEEPLEQLKLPAETAKYPLNFLSHPNLDDDIRFMELKSHLKDYYKQLYIEPSQSLQEKSRPNWNKNLYQSLHLLLAEVVLSKDLDGQLLALSNTYTWYRSKTEINKFHYIPPSPKKSSGIVLPELNSRFSKRSKLPTRLSPINGYKKARPSRDEIIDSINQKYNDMLNMEKISLGCGSTRNKMFNNRDSRSQLSHYELKEQKTVDADADVGVDVDETEVQLDKNSATPEVTVEYVDNPMHISFLHDFRSTSHKARMISPGRGPVKYFNQVSAKHHEVDEIEKIKARLAKNNINVSVNNLENALLTHFQVPYENLTPKGLPRGGDMLSKSPLPKQVLKARKSSLTKKKKKK